ncbi:hypothetical protein Tco_1521805 [Tanacetum coccineum]
MLWIHEATRVREDEDIDIYVSAELPSIDADPECHQIVSKLMMHGPCGLACPSAKCMQNTSECKKTFSKGLSLEKAYAPHSTSREYTLKTQLLRIEMHNDETPDAYLNHAQEYVDALATISEPVKDKDLVMLAVS